MNDYLWDGAGESDSEIERLESALRPLRYVPPAKPLVVPTQFQARTARNSSVMYWALAASVAFLALGLGAWLLLRTGTQPLNVASLSANAGGELVWTVPVPAPDPITEVPDTPRIDRPAIARQNLRRDRQEQIAARARADQREGRLAAEKLLKALQITSDQLNYVRTRAAQTGGQTPDS